jgi:DNA-binding NarL/FixJ family response regulator
VEAGNGVPLISLILESISSSKILINFFSYLLKNKNNVDYYFKQGADGYLYEDSDMSSLLKAYQDIKDGKFSFPEEVTQHLLKNMSSNQKQLTNKEMEMIKYISDGYSSKEIAKKLKCNSNTVNVHKFNMKYKLNIKSNSELIRYCRSLAMS